LAPEDVDGAAKTFIEPTEVGTRGARAVDEASSALPPVERGVAAGGWAAPADDEPDTFRSAESPALTDARKLESLHCRRERDCGYGAQSEEAKK
jgi:hypothetical protein